MVRLYLFVYLCFIVNNTKVSTISISDLVKQFLSKNGELPEHPIINAVTVHGVSAKVLQFVEDMINGKRSFNQNEVDRVVNLIGKLSKKIDLLPVREISANVLSSISKLVENWPAELDLDSFTLMGFRNDIGNIATRAPLQDGVFNFTSTNIAIEVQALSASDIQNLKFNELDLSNGRIGIKKMKDNITPSDDDHGLVEVPMQSVLRALSEHEKQNLKRLSVSLYKNATLFNRQSESKNIIGKVISVIIPDATIKNLDENVELAFRHENVKKDSALLHCVYWNQNLDGGLGNWARDGCRLVSSRDHVTKCGCNHLTSFALLLDVYGQVRSLCDTRKDILTWISIIACNISVVSLILTLMTYGIFEALRADVKSQILINLSVALLMANLLFLMQSIESKADNVFLCKSIAIFLHYFLLSSLTWMAVEAFYMYKSVIKVFNIHINDALLKFSLVGWGAPFIVILLTSLLNPLDNYGLIGSKLCWIKNPAFYIAFVIPVGLIMIFNFIVFKFVFRQLQRLSSTGQNRLNKEQLFTQLKGAFIIMILFGLTWLFAFFAGGIGTFVFSGLFTIFNSLQGLFIFLIYCVFKPDVRHYWKRTLLRQSQDIPTSTKSTTGASFTTSTKIESITSDEYNSRVPKNTTVGTTVDEEVQAKNNARVLKDTFSKGYETNDHIVHNQEPDGLSNHVELGSPGLKSD